MPTADIPIIESKANVDGGVVEYVNEEGTYHQAQLGYDPAWSIRHFFSPLDSAAANAVNMDAMGVQYTDAEEVCITTNDHTEYTLTCHYRISVASCKTQDRC